MLYNRVKYIMEHKGFSFEIAEPINWDSDDKEFVRNETYHGIVVNISDSIQFTGDAKLYLQSVLNEYGVNADVKLTRYIRDEQDKWIVDYVGHIDLLTSVITKKYFEVKFNSDKTINIFKSKNSAIIELENNSSLDSTRQLEDLEIDTVYIDGRELLLKSHCQQSEDAAREMKCKGSNSTELEFYMPVSLNVINKDDQNVHDVFSFQQELYEDIFYDQDAVYSNSLSGAAPRDLRISVSIKHKLNIIKDEVRYFGIKVLLAKGVYNANIAGYNVIGEPRELWAGNYESTEINFSTGEFVEHLEIDEALCLMYFVKGTFGNAIVFQGFDGKVIVRFGDKINEEITGEYLANISFSEDSVRNPTNSNCLRLYNVGKRLTDSILDVPFRSSLCGLINEGYKQDGELSKVMILHGMWLRGLTNGYEKYKHIATSFSDFYNSVNAIMPIGLEVSDKRVVLEKREYFYQKFVAIKVEGVTDLRIELDSKNHFSIINVGYEKAGGYEEEQGLDDYNRKTQYSTILNVTNNTLELLSKYRSDTYGLETIRRENVEINPNVKIDDDKKFDDDIWFLDTKKTSEFNYYQLSLWQDRFEELPKNVYSPETAFNLWFSPINLLLRHGPWIKPCVRQYLDSMIAYTSSEGNSNIITKLIGGNAYQQNIGIPVEDLEASANKAMTATFKAPVTFEQLNGSKYGIPNVYGLVEFKYEGVKYYGHIIKVSLNKGIGDFEVRVF